jgi:thiol-disulfide isomerase/thioredoxin
MATTMLRFYVVLTTARTVGAACIDTNEQCPSWAAVGECQQNPGFMLETCRKSCNACDENPACSDSNIECAAWAANGECEKNPTFMHETCRKSCKTCDKPSYLQAMGQQGRTAPEHVVQQQQQQQQQQQRQQQQQQARPVLQPGQELWELEDLTQPYPNSAMADVDLKGLTALANRTDHPIFAWFYAPWCKQCKVVRPAVEAAAKRFSEPSGKPITFAKLDCVADLEGKKFFDVNSCGWCLRRRPFPAAPCLPLPCLPSSSLPCLPSLLGLILATRARRPLLQGAARPSPTVG